MKSFYFVAVLFVSFVLFTACGGESCEENCIEPVDEISTTDENEVADDTTDETVDETEDEVVDEVTDEDTTPVSCEEDENCKEICKNFLDFAGDWTIVEPETVSGNVTIILSVNGLNCKIALVGKWSGLVWEGSEPPLNWIQDPGTLKFFSLQKMEGEKMVIARSSSEDYSVDSIYKFIKK